MHTECIQELKSQFLDLNNGTCDGVVQEYNATNTVQLKALGGLWIVLGSAILGSFLVAGVQFYSRRWWKRRSKSGPAEVEGKDLDARATTIRRALTRVLSFRRSSNGDVAAKSSSAAGGARVPFLPCSCGVCRGPLPLQPQVPPFADGTCMKCGVFCHTLH
jgi:hypothetical protein